MSTHQYTAVTHVYTIHFALRNAITNCILHLHQMWQPTNDRPGSPASHTAAKVRRSILWYVAIRCCMSWCVVVRRCAANKHTSFHISTHQCIPAHISTHRYTSAFACGASTHQYTSAHSNNKCAHFILHCEMYASRTFCICNICGSQQTSGQPAHHHTQPPKYVEVRRDTPKYIVVRRGTS